MILSITGSLSAFEPPYVITKGEFGTGTYFVIMDKLAHASQKVGLASAMAVVLLIIILLVTFIQKAAFKYFFGEGEQEAIRTVRKEKTGEERTERAVSKFKQGGEQKCQWQSLKSNLDDFKYATLLLAIFIAVLPLVSCVITAFKTPEEYASTNVMQLPQSWTYFENFIQAWKQANMATAFRNSFIYPGICPFWFNL